MSASLADEATDVETPKTTTQSNKEEQKEILTTDANKLAEQSQLKDEHVRHKCEDNSKNENDEIPQDTDDKKESIKETAEVQITQEPNTQKEVVLSTAKHKVVVDEVTPESNKVDEGEQSPEEDTTKIPQSIKANDNTSTQPHISEADTQTIALEEKSPAEKQSPAQQTPPPELDTQATQTKEETYTEQQSSKPSKSAPTGPSKKDEHAEHVTYTEDGSAIYTDPQTKYKYKWCTTTNNWTPCEAETTSSTSSNPYENEHYKWCQETQQWIPKQKAAQVTETEHYKWDAEKQEWIAKKKVDGQVQPTAIVYDIDEDGQRIYTDKDGTVFFWDVEKNAWFPKIDDDFMARYQMSYGFIDNTSESEREKQQMEKEAAAHKAKELEKMTEEAMAYDESSQGAGVKRKAQQEPPKWFEVEPERNTKVYVSNLPLDITLDEFTEVMSKCGMIMRDPQTQKFKLKLYTEADGQIKGDGLCDYIKVESVDLALNILDGYDLRGHKMRVQQAQFQMRGEYNPALKPKRKKKDKEKMAKIKEKLFDWRPEKMRGERSKNEKTVIIKNLFQPELFEKEVQLILDYQNDLREECSKCGIVRKVVIYDRHSEGVAQINMASPEEADLVIQMMQGRFFGKRQLTAEHWDGKTKYKIEETQEEIQKRLNKWDNYLETDEHKADDKLTPNEEKSPECEKATISKKSEKSEVPVPTKDVAT